MNITVIALFLICCKKWILLQICMSCNVTMCKWIRNKLKKGSAVSLFVVLAFINIKPRTWNAALLVTSFIVTCLTETVVETDIFRQVNNYLHKVHWFSGYLQSSTEEFVRSLETIYQLLICHSSAVIHFLILHNSAYRIQEPSYWSQSSNIETENFLHDNFKWKKVLDQSC